VGFRTKWYFYYYKIKVKRKGKDTVEKTRNTVVDLLKEEKGRESTNTFTDPHLITARFRVENVEEASQKTTQLKKILSEYCEEIEQRQGYKDHISTAERAIKNDNNAKRKKSFWFALSLYLATVFGGSAIAGSKNGLQAFLSHATLQTQLQDYANAFYGALLVAIPAFIIPYLKNPQQKSQQPA
jgi:hypothetical protein